jgi:hypothetical protein
VSHVRSAAALLVLLVLGAGLAGSAVSAGPQHRPPGRVLLVTIPRLTWDQVSMADTPNLQRFLEQSAVGDLSLRTLGPRTSIGAGYATIGAGNRAGVRDSDAGRVLATSDRYENGTAGEAYQRRTGLKPNGRLVQLSIPAIQSRNDRYLFGAKPGILGTTLRAAGYRSILVSNGDIELAQTGVVSVNPLQITGPPDNVSDPVLPNGPANAQFLSTEPTGTENRPAGLAIMDEEGSIESGSVSRKLVATDPHRAFGLKMSPERVLAALAARWKPKGVAVVELSDLDRADAYRGTATSPQGTAMARAALHDSDALLGKLLATTTADDLVMVLSPTAPRAAEALTPIGVRSPAFRSGTLVSGTTRRRGYVTLPDIAPTILEQLGLAKPDAMTGAAMTADNSGNLGPSRWGHFLRMNEATRFRDSVAGPVTVLFVILQVVFSVMAIAAIAFDSARLRRPASLLALFTMGLPFVAFAIGLLPQKSPGFFPYLAILTVGAVVIAFGARAIGRLAAPRSRVVVTAMIPAAIVFVLLVIDITTGGRLEINTTFGYSPLVAGRFDGFGNPAYSIFAMSALVLACGMWTVLGADRRGPGRRAAIGFVVVVFVVAIVLDGHPSFGSDVGGTISILPAAILVLWLLLGRRVRVRVVLLAAVGTAALLGVFAAIDLSRPVDSQTHLARLISQTTSGDSGGSGLVIQRKIDSNLSILTHSVWTWAIPLSLVLLIRFARRRPQALQKRLADSPSNRACLWGGITLCVLGTALNDSGIAVTAVMFMIFLPYIVYLVTAPVTLDEVPGGEDVPVGPDPAAPDPGPVDALDVPAAAAPVAALT